MQVSKFELYASFWTPMMYQNQGSESYIFLTIERTREIMPVNCTKYKTQRRRPKKSRKKGNKTKPKKTPTWKEEEKRESKWKTFKSMIF
jgi:predicted peroxiredoxin